MPNDTTTQPVQQTTLGALRQPVIPEQNMPAVRIGFNDTQGFALMQRVSTALASSTLVPQQFQGNLPNCLIALEMAQRIGASPLMVMQNLYIVHGRPGWSAKFLIASFNQCGRFTAIRFEWSGTRDKDDWGCRAWATEKSTGEKIQGPLITIALAKKEKWYDKSGSKWQTIPELMLTYRAAAWMVNTHAPEISMGLNTAEELNDVFDATRAATGEFEVTTNELQQQNGAGVDKSTGEITGATDATDLWTDWQEQLAKAKNAEDLDYLRGLVKELTDEHQAEATEMIGKRAATIAGEQASAKK